VDDKTGQIWAIIEWNLRCRSYPKIANRTGIHANVIKRHISTADAALLPILVSDASQTVLVAARFLINAVVFALAFIKKRVRTP